MKITKILLIFLLLGASTTNSYANEKLILSVKKFSECFRNSNFECISIYTTPYIVEQAGGKQKFVQLMEATYEAIKQQNVRMLPDTYKTYTPNKVVEHNNFLIAVIPTQQAIVMNDSRGLIRGSVFGYSPNKGRNWYFVEGNNESIELINHLVPGALSKVSLPDGNLFINNINFIQKNGKWVKQ